MIYAFMQKNVIFHEYTCIMMNLKDSNFSYDVVWYTIIFKVSAPYFFDKKTGDRYSHPMLHYL